MGPKVAKKWLKSFYEAWSIKNPFMVPIIFGNLGLLTDGYMITIVFQSQLMICKQLVFQIIANC